MPIVSAVREHPTPSLVASPGAALLTPVVVQLVLPITVVLIGDASGAERMLRQRRYRRPACHARAQQLEINWQQPVRHRPRPQAAQVAQASHCRPRRQRPVRPHAAADALALQHMDLAEKIAGNFARRTVHPKEDLLQLAMIGLIKAARRYDPSRGPFRPYGRTYANGEITHYLRDHGFAIKVPPSWRDLYASGQKLLREGLPPHAVAERLGTAVERWREIQDACSITVIALQQES